MRKKNNGIDNYSEENTLKYLEKCGLNNERYVKRLNLLYTDIFESGGEKSVKKLVCLHY